VDRAASGLISEFYKGLCSWLDYSLHNSMWAQNQGHTFGLPTPELTEGLLRQLSSEAATILEDVRDDLQRTKDLVAEASNQAQADAFTIGEHEDLYKWRGYLCDRERIFRLISVGLEETEGDQDSCDSHMDPSRIKFGTDGWRGLIGEDFTLCNVRACAQAVAAYHLAEGLVGQPIFVGYDTRFASKEFAAATAEVIAGNGLNVLLSSVAVPTPVASYNIVHRAASGGVIITASHNPALWNGFKYRTHYGGSPSPEVLVRIEREVGCVGSATKVQRLSLTEATRCGLNEFVQPASPYMEHVSRMLDLKRLQSTGLNVVVDSMHGAGAGYLVDLLTGGETRVEELRGDRNPAFPGMHNPEPIARNLVQLTHTVTEQGADIGLALDGDADRLGIIDEKGTFVTPLQTFALLAYYFLEVLGERGTIIKSLTNTSMAWLLGERYDVQVLETGVGFKFIAPLMLEHEAMLGGEESGGYAIRGHIPERDGILSGLLILDLMARTQKRPAELVQKLYDLVGPHHYNRLDVPLELALKDQVRDRVAKANPDYLCGIRVVRRDTIDGFRFILRGGGWLVIRFSGTEPILRIYAEAESPDRVTELLRQGRELTGI
jgi:phosphomannomutase